MEEFIDPFIRYSDMSYNAMYQPPTPSDSEDANKSPRLMLLESSPGNIVTTFSSLSCNNMNILPTDAVLEIVEQPVEKFRFRYKSEMSGTHGCLQGASSERNRKPNFPTVRLRNYNEPAIVRCSLYTYSKGAPEHCRQPHPHRLVMKNDCEERVDPHDKRLDPQANPSMKIVFKGMGIIHTAKKYIQDELKIKKTKLKEEEIFRTEGIQRALTVHEFSDIKRQIQDEEKSINLNVVCLRFDAMKEENGILQHICKPIYSNPIFNLKSAMTGDLRIVRMDHVTSPASGGKEIFLLVEKVAKKNIKVQFVELDGNETICWRADAKFHENDVHHQYAIVIKTPPYRDLNIEENTTDVFIQLYRPSDGETSEPRRFTYIPDRHQKRKRGRYDDYNSSSSLSMEIGIPQSVNEFNTTLTPFTSDDFQKYVPFANSEDLKDLFPEIVKNFGENSTSLDGTQRKTMDSNADDINKIRKQYYQFTSYLNCGQPVEQRIRKALFEDKNKDGNNILHLCHFYQTSESIKLKTLLLSIIKQYKLYDLLNIPNAYDETVYYISIRNGAKLNQLKDLPLEHMQINGKGGFYPLHEAIKYDYGIDEICECFKNKILKQCNEDSLLPLLYAVEIHKLDAVKKLLSYGAQINAQDNRTGNNALEMAIIGEQLEMVEYLFKSTPINKSHVNFDNKNYLIIAKERANSEVGKKIFQLVCSAGEDALEMLDNALVKQEEFEDNSSDEEEEEFEDTLEVDIKLEETTVLGNGNELALNHIIKELSCLDLDITTINKLYEDLNFGFILNTNAFKTSNKIEFLLNLALKHEVNISEIRTVFEENDVEEGVKCIDRWMKKN